MVSVWFQLALAGLHSLLAAVANICTSPPGFWNVVLLPVESSHQDLHRQQHQ